MDTKALRQKILDLAIRGKLVPQDPNDEPASVLLERIREQKKQMVKDGKLKPKDIKKDTVIFKGDDNLHYEKFPDGTVKCIEDEIPFDLPDGWEWARLKSVIHFIRNGASIKQYRDAKGLPITRIETIATGAIDRNRLGYANIFEVDKYASYILKDYDILMSHINSPKHLGKCALYENKGNEKIIHGMNLLAIRTFSCSLAKYMCILFRSTVFKGFVWEHMKQAVNQASITTTSISNLLFAIPPVEEQTRIIDFFDDANKYMIEIDTDKDIIEQDISFAKSKILDLAIHGKLVPQDPNDEPASVLLERIRAEKEELIKQGKIKRNKKESVIFKGDDNSYYQDLPENWIKIRLSSISEIITKGTTPRGGRIAYSQSGIGFLRAENIAGYDKLNLSNLNYIDEESHNNYLKRSILKENDILITIAGTLGRTGIVPQQALPLNTNQAVAIIRLVDKNIINVKYLVYAINSPQIKDDLLDKSVDVAIPNLSLENIADCNIPFPPFAEQKRIVTAIEEAFSKLDKISESLA